MLAKPPACSGCPRERTGRGYVPGHGPASALLCVLGEQPGANEVAEGRPFVGASGAELDKALGGPAVREGIYVTNVRKCLGPEVEPKAVRAASIAHCTAAYLSGEFVALSGVRTLLAVGADALEVVTGRRDVMRAHGSVWTRDEGEAQRDLGRT